MSTVSQVEFFSTAMNQHVSYTVILPDVGEGPFPVLMQLHGLSDSHMGWLQRTRILGYAADLPMAIVFPDGGTGAYLNWLGYGRLDACDTSKLGSRTSTRKRVSRSNEARSITMCHVGAVADLS